MVLKTAPLDVGCTHWALDELVAPMDISLRASTHQVAVCSVLNAVYLCFPGDKHPLCLLAVNAYAKSLEAIYDRIERLLYRWCVGARNGYVVCVETHPW